MTNIVNINEHMPHIVVDGLGGNQHVIPVQFFNDVRLGKVSLKELECFEAIMPIIINEWMLGRNI